MITSSKKQDDWYKNGEQENLKSPGTLDLLLNTLDANQSSSDLT